MRWIRIRLFPKTVLISSLSATLELVLCVDSMDSLTTVLCTCTEYVCTYRKSTAEECWIPLLPNYTSIDSHTRGETLVQLVSDHTRTSTELRGFPYGIRSRYPVIECSSTSPARSSSATGTHVLGPRQVLSLPLLFGRHLFCFLINHRTISATTTGRESHCAFTCFFFFFFF